MMQHYIDDLTLFTQEQAMHRLRTDSFCRTSFVLSQASIDEMTTRLSEEQRLIAQ